MLKTAIGKENDKINLPNSFNIENKPVSDKTEIDGSSSNLFLNIGVPSMTRDFEAICLIIMHSPCF